MQKMIFVLLFFTFNTFSKYIAPKKKDQVTSETIKVESIKNDDNSSVKNKKTRGYFGKSTNFYDKQGNAKLLNKDFKSLSFEELEHNRNIHKKDKDLETIIRYTERMITVCKEPIKIGQLRLEAADLHYQNKNFERAAAFYTEFTKMYPGSKDFEHALHRTILSKYQMSMPADKDQTQTRDAVKAAKEYLENEKYTQKRKEVQAILDKCNAKLLDYELNNFNFYLNKKNINACQKRLKYIKESYFKENEQDPLLVELEKQIQAAQENKKYKPNYIIKTNTNLLENIGLIKKQPDEIIDNAQ